MKSPTGVLSFILLSLALHGHATAADPPDELMNAIYASLTLELPQGPKDAVRAGSEVTVTTILKNHSPQSLEVPVNEKFSRPMNLVGTVQYWIERLGPDPSMPFPKTNAREGNIYAFGGHIIQSRPKLGTKGRIELEKVFETKDWAPGEYNLTVQYKKLAGEVVSEIVWKFSVK